MIRDRVLPDEIHNYVHNNEWLIRNLSHVGRVHDAVEMARNMIELPRHPRLNTLTTRGSAALGRQRLFEVLDRYDLWDDMIKLCQSSSLEPTNVPAEQIKRLRYLGTAYIRQGAIERGNAQLQELKKRLSDQQAGKPKAIAEAEAKVREQLKSDQAQKKGPADPKAVETAKSNAAKPFDEQIQQLEKAIAALDGHLAIHRKQYREGLKLLTKAEDIDGMYLAQLQGLAASGDNVIIQQVKAVGTAFVAGEQSHVQVAVENTNEVPIENIVIELTAGQENVVRQSIEKLDAKQNKTVDFKFRFQPGGKVQLGAKIVRADAAPEAAARKYVTEHEGEARPLAGLVEILWNAGKKEAAAEQFKQLREVAATADLDVPVFARLRPVAEYLQLPSDWRLAKRHDSADAVARPSLDTLGPFRWSPAEAPSWKLADAKGHAHSLADYRGRPVIVVFYLGHGCLHCVKQLQAFAPRTKDFSAAGISLIAISSDSDADLKLSLAKFAEGEFPFPLVSDATVATFKSYRAYDDFENQPLHGTFLVDAAGRVRWQDIRFEPFMDVDFLLGEAKRLLAN
jgi:peroxiredoxin